LPFFASFAICGHLARLSCHLLRPLPTFRHLLGNEQTTVSSISLFQLPITLFEKVNFPILHVNLCFKICVNGLGHHGAVLFYAVTADARTSV